MQAASAGLVAGVSRKPLQGGSPVTLGALCLLAAALGALVGVGIGSQAEQNTREAEDQAVEAARTAVATRLEQRLQESKETLDLLDKDGMLQEAKDLEQARRLGLAQALENDLARLTPDEGRRVLAALVREGRKNDLDPMLIAAVIRVETHFDPYAVSSVGARGLMQLMPGTAAEVAQKLGVRVSTRQLFNPVVNIELGAAYLKTLITRFGDVRTALIAYNAGPTLARQSRLSPGVRAYPRNVLGEYERIAWQASREAGAALAAADAN